MFISEACTAKFCRRLRTLLKAHSKLRHTYFNISQNQSSFRLWVPTQHAVGEVTLTCQRSVSLYKEEDKKRMSGMQSPKWTPPSACRCVMQETFLYVSKQAHGFNTAHCLRKGSLLGNPLDELVFCPRASFTTNFDRYIFTGNLPETQ